MPVSLGKRITVKMDPRFYYHVDFGDKHNNGWNQCLDACQATHTFLDVGAHIGLYTLPAALIMRGRGQVHAFEPSPVNFEHLNRHIKMNDLTNVTVTETLVGDSNAPAILNFDDSDVNAMNTMAKLESGPKASFRALEVKQTRIDDYCSQKSIKPDLIKIDVEGADLKVLKGAEQTLRKFKPRIFLSLHPALMKKMGDEVEDLVTFMQGLGYEIVNLDGTKPREWKLEEYLLRPLGK